MPDVFNGPVAAVLVPQGRGLVARPLFASGSTIQLKQDRKRSSAAALKRGELVVVEPAGITRSKRGGRQVTQQIGQIVRRVGSPDVTRDVLEALMIERGLARRFPGLVEREAQKAAESEDQFDRRDLSDLTTFTMDPHGAKDYDDAISAEREGDKIRIWVHIADVSSFVRPGDIVDQEAYRRSTSTYVPGAVEPMLPEALSNGACSLLPGEPRRAVTVEMLFSEDEVESAAFYRSLVRSDARLTYDQVDDIFADATKAEDPWATPLELARLIGSALETQREKRKALAVESSEPKFEFDQRGDASDVHNEVQTEAHKVIEHLMISANEQVALYLTNHKLPALFRVHERPGAEAVKRLVEQLASLDVSTPPIPEHFGDQQAEQLVGEISIKVAEHIRRTGQGRAGLTSLVLRSLKQAVYSPGNLGHSGLRSTHYCHFTSPIRRYPDLIVHRALLAGLGVDDAAPVSRDLAENAEWTSGQERASMSIERRADDICRAFLLEKVLIEGGWTPPPSETAPPPTRAGGGRSGRPVRPPRRDREGARGNALNGPVFQGEVVGLIGGGLFVAFGPDSAFEGFIPLRELKEQRGGFWNLNAEQTGLVDENSGHTIKLGQNVEVAVLGVETARARVDLLPVTI